MLRKSFVLIGLVFALCTPGLALAQGETDPASWTPRPGDRFLVDVKANEGYLVHSDGTFVAFPVATGQRRTVWYIGRTYYAATPERHWTVKEINIKGDHITFGPTGRFLRLFTDDGKSTPYGLHGHASSKEMLSEDGSKRFRSMGCVIVSEQVLSLLERSVNVNDGTLDVTTLSGLVEPAYAQTAFVWEAKK